MHARLQPCIHEDHDDSGRDAAEQIAADRLPIFQRKNTYRIWWLCYWLRSGYRVGRVSETKGNALA